MPVKTVETIRKSLSEPWAAWRIDRLTTYLAELNDDEQTTQNQLSDILQSLQIDDQSVRTAVEDLFEVGSFTLAGCSSYVSVCLRRRTFNGIVAFATN